MIEVKKKSVVPVYGTAVIWVIYCLIVSLNGVLPFIGLAITGVVSYLLLAMFFPGSVIQVEADEKPQSTGDEKVDTLLADGKKSIKEMQNLRESILNEEVKAKADDIINITDNIFKKLQSEPGVYTQVKRFADFFLPTTVKLLNSYDRFGQSGVEGENISGTMERINAALDTTALSYKKFYDSLFENQALDIETDISVFDTMLKKEGLLDSDFETKNT